MDMFAFSKLSSEDISHYSCYSMIRMHKTCLMNNSHKGVKEVEKVSPQEHEELQSLNIGPECSCSHNEP